MEQLARRLNHENHGQMLLWIIPERGACGTEPIVIPRRAFDSSYAFLSPDRKSEAEPVAGSRQIGGGAGADLAQVVRGHESNSCGAQYAVAVEDATILQHLQKLRIIERSRNHALAARFPFGRKSWIAEWLGAHNLAVGRQRFCNQILFCRVG